MIKFSEAVRQFSEEKKRRGLSPIVNSKELARIRQAYKEGKFNEEDEKEDKDGEKKEMTEVQKRRYNRMLANFRDYKESKGLGRGVSTKQKKMIEQTILMGTAGRPQCLKDNAKTIIAGPKVQEDKVDIEEIKGKIREARKFAYKAKMALKENDMLGAADATQAAGDAVNAADAATAPAAEGAVPQNIVDAISNIKTSVDQLATQCGIESPIDFGGDPNAGVPAVDGTMQDPNAGQPAAQPVQESLDKAKARLAKREAVLAKVKEGDGQDAITAAINAMTNPQQFHDIDKKDSEELVKPTTAKSKEAANTWPTVKGTYKESGTEKMITDKLNESQNNWSWNDILRNGILG